MLREWSGEFFLPGQRSNYLERKTMWKKALFVLMSLLSLGLTACNTISGAGQDVAAAGNKVTEEAQEHKRY
jgi:predicted small secreted protein